MIQVIKTMELQNGDKVETLIFMIGTNDVPRSPVTLEVIWEPLLICLVNELKEKLRPRLVVLSTSPFRPDAGSAIAELMNMDLAPWIEMVGNLVAENPSELRLMEIENTLRMVDHHALARDGMLFNTQQGIQWINGAFQTKIKGLEAELQTIAIPATSGGPSGRIATQQIQQLADHLRPLMPEASDSQPTLSSDLRERLRTVLDPEGRSLESRLGTRNGPRRPLTLRVNLRGTQRLKEVHKLTR